MSVPLREVPMAEIVTFHNGKAPPKDEGTDHPVYGSNGQIGRSAKFNHESAIILGRVGAYCGSVEVCDDKFWASDNTIVVKPRDGFDLTYLYYRLKSVRLNALAGGAAQPLLTQGVLKPFHIQVPDQPTQIEIASILSAYDDLIENNRRRIALLEEAAKQLYKEWFVRFRFPGHEHVPIVDGVPEGWIATIATDAMEVLSGGTPKTGVEDYWDGDIPFFTPKDATASIYANETEKTLTDRGLNSCASKLFEKDTIFITARGTVGKLNLAQSPMAMNQSCYALVAKQPLNQVFLYFALSAAIQQFKARAVGAVFDAIIKDTFNAIPFIVPSTPLVEQFTDVAKDSICQIDTLLKQNERLRRARNILLPRLMSGEITV